MSFTVQPDALHQSAARLRTCADDVAAAETYSLSWLDLPAGTGGRLFEQVAQSVREFDQSLTTALSHLTGLLGAQASALDASAQTYQDVDGSARRHLLALRGAGPR